MSDTHKAFNKLYTGMGDKGDTTTIGGHARKNSAIVHSYGEVDELNSHVGVLVAELKETTSPEHINTHLMYIQNWLFDLGTDLSNSISKPNYRLGEEHVKALEDFIDDYTTKVAPIDYFVLPTGSVSASQAHVCRAVTRRAERAMYDTDIRPEYIGFKFINRLSDYFFALARYLNTFHKCEERGYHNDKKVYKSDK